MLITNSYLNVSKSLQPTKCFEFVKKFDICLGFLVLLVPRPTETGKGPLGMWVHDIQPTSRLLWGRSDVYGSRRDRRPWVVSLRLIRSRANRNVSTRMGLSLCNVRLKPPHDSLKTDCGHTGRLQNVPLDLNTHLWYDTERIKTTKRTSVRVSSTRTLIRSDDQFT